MGEVDLLQYYHGILYVPVTEVHLYESQCCRLDTSPLNWAAPWPCLFRKRHPENPGLIDPTFSVALLYWTPLYHAVLVLAVRIQ